MPNDEAVHIATVPDYPAPVGPATLLRWLVEDGDEVAPGHALAELEADKVVFLLTSPAAGRLTRLAPAGVRLAPGTAAATVTTPAPAPAPAPVSGAAIFAAAASEDAAAEATRTLDLEALRALHREARKHTPPPVSTNSDRAVFVAPAAGGSADNNDNGNDDAPTPEEIEAALHADLPPAGALPLDEGYDPREIDAMAGPPEPLPPARAVTARRMAASNRQAPCFALETSVDMSAAVSLRAWLRGQPGRGKATYNDMLLWSVARSLARHRRLAMAWTPAGLVPRDRINLGFALAMEPEGLVVPVLRDADRLDLTSLSARVLNLARRARERRLTPADYAGGVFTVTNLGQYPVDAFTAVVNPGESAILAAGRVAEGAWVENGALTVRWQMRLTLTVDHRVADGAEGARFLATLKAVLESLGDRPATT